MPAKKSKKKTTAKKTAKKKAAESKPKLTKSQMTALDGLKTAIQTEIDGYNFYILAAQKTKDDKGKQMFEYLAQEEAAHREILENQYKYLVEEGKWGKLPKPTKVPKQFKAKSPIFTPEFSKRTKLENFELSALSIGILLEQKSIDYYRKLSKQNRDPKAKKMFDELAKWEGEHLKLLTNQHNMLQREYWAEAGFEPLF